VVVSKKSRKENVRMAGKKMARKIWKHKEDRGRGEVGSEAREGREPLVVGGRREGRR
jgi:hypothetical protein